jgi:hypothetical protein
MLRVVDQSVYKYIYIILYCSSARGKYMINIYIYRYVINIKYVDKVKTEQQCATQFRDFLFCSLRGFLSAIVIFNCAKTCCYVDILFLLYNKRC